MIGLPLSQWRGADPRVTAAQRKALEALRLASPDSRILGLDHALRPVVLANLGYPRAQRCYALLPNGDPAVPKLAAGPALVKGDDYVSALLDDAEGLLFEAWTDRWGR